MDASRLGKRLSLTPMAVRQHLYDLQREKLVSAEERSAAVGRPVKYWRLTRGADRLFPSAYAELSVALIDALRAAEERIRATHSCFPAAQGKGPKTYPPPQGGRLYGGDEARAGRRVPPG